MEELLVKLYRGQTFGETALDNAAGKRTAGAKASQPTYLLSLDVSDYKRIFASYKVQLKNEVRELLSTSAAFSNWEKESIDKLASSATIQSFGGGHTLVEAGSPVSTLYIIKCGVIKLLKDVAAPDVNNIQISEFFTPDTHDVGGMVSIRLNVAWICCNEAKKCIAVGESRNLGPEEELERPRDIIL